MILPWLVVHASDAVAQTAVCSNTPATGERVECTEDSTSTDGIGILLEGVDIDIAATVVNTHAVSAKHEGTGDIDIDVTQDLNDSGEVVRSTIDTSGKSQAYAVYGEHTGTGTVDVSVSTTTISTAGRTAHGVHARHYGTGLIRFDVSSSRINTEEKDAHGIHAVHHSTDTGDDANANVQVTATSNSVVTAGQSAHGIRGRSDGKGDVMITTTSNTITTRGKEAVGIYGYHLGDGDILITSTQDTIATENEVEGEDSIAIGILGWHQQGNGDTNLRVTGGSVKTAGTFAPGIYAVHGLSEVDPVTTQGAVDIDVENAVIETAGRWSYGIYALHSGSGAVRVATRGGQRTATTGADAHGIVAYQTGTEDDRSIDITVGGTVDVQGTDADGVRVGRVSSGNADRAAAFDEDGYRRHTVTVNGSIESATGAGVFLAGGGKVFIGPAGSIDADSGIAVLATGDTPGESLEDPAMKPKLFVGMQLDGRRVAAVLGDGWIINDGGETTILVNDVKLHDGSTGVVPGAVAANGAWDVTVRDAGVRVTDRTNTDPADWDVSEPATGVIADRDFSTDDFTETRASCPPGQLGTPPNCRRPPPPPRTPPPRAPPPRTCPAGQVGTPPDCRVPPPPMCPAGKIGTPPDCTTPPLEPEIVETYAPRAAVHEALPGFLLRLNAPGSGGAPLAVRRLAVWTRLSGRGGAYEPERASVGARYGFDRRSLETGFGVPLVDGVVGMASFRSLRGFADVSATTGGGSIEANGLGGTLGLSVSGTNGSYARGRLSYAEYALNIASDMRGSLKTDVDARGYFTGLEAGQRLNLDDGTFVTPRLKVMSSKIDVEDFADAVGSRVSVVDASRRTVSLGIEAGFEGARLSGGAFDLRASLDLVRSFGRAVTRVQVSGEELFSAAAQPRHNIAVSGIWRCNGLTVDMGISVLGLGSGDSHRSGHIVLTMRF